MGILEELSNAQDRVVGSKQIMKMASLCTLRKVYIAMDADQSLSDKLRHVCEKNGIEYDMSATMSQIGIACSIEVKSACAALIK